MTGRVCVATGGHLATCPRMLKAADALGAAGYDVRVVSVLTAGWATTLDPELAAGKPWRWTPVDLRRSARPDRWLRSGLRRRGCRALAGRLGPARLPVSLAGRAYSRAASEVARAIAGEPCDLIYAGTNTALAAAPRAARFLRVPYALDLEDLHSAEHPPDAVHALDLALAARLEAAALPGARFLTAASAGIAEAYRERYGVTPIAIHNAFPLPAEAPVPWREPIGVRRLYWFSQTVGPDRGLESLVEGLGRTGVPVELTLQGSASTDYQLALASLVARSATALRLTFRAPCPPEDLLNEARRHHAGLSLEQVVPESRALCLTNKALLYPLAGLPVLLSDTPGQRPFGEDLGPGAVLFAPGDPAALAQAILPWLQDDALLLRAREASWQAAQRRWHWEHPLERGALLSAVARALGRETPCGSR